MLCYRIGLAIEIAGTILLSTNLIMDTAYLFKQTFAGRGLYAVYCVLMAIRFLIPIMNAVRYCTCRLNDPEIMLVDDGNKATQKQLKVSGMLLYSALPLSYLTGCYRLLNFKNFYKEIGLGLVIDLLLNTVAMLIVQGLNNSYLNTNAAEDGLVF